MGERNGGVDARRIETDDLPEEVRELARALCEESAALADLYPGRPVPCAARRAGAASISTRRLPQWKVRAVGAAVLVLASLALYPGLRSTFQGSGAAAESVGKPEVAGESSTSSAIRPRRELPVDPPIELIEFDDPLLHLSDPELEGTLDWLEQRPGERLRVSL